MKKIYFLLIFLVFKGIAQNDSISNCNFERVYIEIGFVKPLGKMDDKFNTATSFGFWFRNKIVRENYIDVGFNFFIPKMPRNIDFRYRDSIVSYKSSRFGILIGTRFSNTISMSKKTNNFNLEWNSGIGLALNFYEAPNELIFKEKEYTREVLTTFYLSQGIKLNYKNIGLQCHYIFSPFDLFNDKINEKYGSQCLMFGLVYKQ